MLIAKLYAFIAKRPGFDYHNYGEPTSYRADVRRATQQLNDARIMLRACELRNVEPDLTAFSGRLELIDGELEYTTGQYYPTEYRAAVCACCARALWSYWRECGYDADGIRKMARQEFGRGIANRWFN